LLEKHHGSLAGQRVAVLGASYRGGVKETAFSGVFDVVDELKKVGAVPLVNDPMYTKGELEKLGFEDYEFGQTVDAVIVQANHNEYRSVLAEHIPGARTIVDGRGVTGQKLREAIPTYVIGAASVLTEQTDSNPSNATLGCGKPVAARSLVAQPSTRGLGETYWDVWCVGDGDAVGCCPVKDARGGLGDAPAGEMFDGVVAGA
ncbi:MAG: UDP binding domain-containing protein, partial [Terrimesophilobacter sp.]